MLLSFYEISFIFCLNFSKCSIGTMAPVASGWPPPVESGMFCNNCFVNSSAFFPRIEMLAFSGRRNATMIVLSGCRNERRFEISELIDVLPE